MTGHIQVVLINSTPTQLLQLGDFLAQGFYQENLAVVLSGEVVQPDLLFPRGSARGRRSGVLDVMFNELNDAREFCNPVVKVVVAVKVEQAV